MSTATSFQAISNASRLSRRELAPYGPNKELAINRGDDGQAPTLTLDQLQRFSPDGTHASFVPPGTSDVVPSPAMRYSDREGNPVAWTTVSRNIAQALKAAAAMRSVDAHFDDGHVTNPVESVIAYARNRRASEANQSLAALDTDLVKLSILGFQIGTDRDRETMAKIDQLAGKLTGGLKKPRDVRNATAVFELSIRRLPADLPFLTIAGMREAMHYVFNELEFNEEVIQFLKHEVPSTAGWTNEHWNYLRGGFKEDLKKVKISGLPDGSIYVGGPLLKVEGPAAICELIETAMMARVSAMTGKATAMALISEVFKGPKMEAGMRRPPSADSGTKDAEACAVVTDATTSHVYAQYLRGMRAAGTMEHSAILLSGAESQTLFFVQFFLMYGRFTTALVDSRTPEEGVRAVIQAQRIIDALRPSLEKDPRYAHVTKWRIPMIRLDSGELRPQAIKFRKLLDEAGMADTGIAIQDGMNADKLKAIIYADETEVRVDSIGAGECIRFPAIVNADGETMRWISNMIYKAGRLYHGDDVIDMMKNSATPEKATRPSRNLYRTFDAAGKMVADVAGYDAHAGEPDVPAAPPGGRVVSRLQPFGADGKAAACFALPLAEYWKETRARFAEELGSLEYGWRERDQRKAAGLPWRPVLQESPALMAVVDRLREASDVARQVAEAAGARG